jgi:3',5'-cyclic AMP phosphodiesterase CpdA
MEDLLERPIYFVLGNHDFYRGSIAETRRRVAEAASRSRCLRYLTELGVVELSPTTALVGHDGWADGRCGDWQNTDVMLNDFFLIQEVHKLDWGFRLDKLALLPLLNALGDQAAAHFRATLEKAAAEYAQVIAVTHVPPFDEAAWHMGRHSDANWLPFFASQAAGDAMREVMAAHPNSQLLVLCGHTHSSGEVAVGNNIRVLTGGARYEHPEIQRIFEIE